MVGVVPTCVSNCAAYVSGFSYSPDFPTTPGAAQTKIGGDADAFVAKLDGTGKVSYATFVGGTGYELGNGIGVDTLGDAFLVGQTFNPSSFPAANPIQSVPPARGDMFVSTDGGATFAASGWSAANGGSINVNGLDLDLSVSPAHLYAGSAHAGLWLSVDAAASFEPIGDFDGQEIEAVAVQSGSAAGPSPLYVAANNTLWSSTNGGTSFAQLKNFPAKKQVLGLFATPALLVAGTTTGVLVSTDHGAHFAASSGFSHPVQVFCAAQDAKSGVLYVGTSSGVFQSANKGSSFKSTNLNFAMVDSLAVDQSANPARIYAGTFSAGVVESSDGFVSSFVFGSTAPSLVNRVRLDPKTSNPARVLVGVHNTLDFGGLFASTDGGVSYSQLDPAGFNPPCCVIPLVADAGSPQRIYASVFEEADIAIAEINPAGSKILFASNLGGSNDEVAYNIPVDLAGNAYIGGLTFSNDYPTLNAAQSGLGPSRTNPGFVNGVLTKISFATPTPTSKATPKPTPTPKATPTPKKTPTASPSPACTAGEQMCSPGQCTNTSTDSKNCGQCGEVCPSNSSCSGSMCFCSPGFTVCDNGTQCCGGTSTPATATPATPAPATATAAPRTPTASASPGCPAGQMMCNGQCINTHTDPNNCGACNSPCNTTNTSSVSCVNGVCQDTCAAGFGNCDHNPANGCETNLRDSDNHNCGFCTGTCNDPSFCEPDGLCHCPTNEVFCGSLCTNTLTDPNNCDPNGNCGTVCPAGGHCVNGTCACPAGQTNCNGQCVDTSSNNTYCGGCFAPPCPTGANCSSGVCTCDFPYENCPNRAGCANISNDFDNCGNCGNQCAADQYCNNFGCLCLLDNQPLGTNFDCAFCGNTCGSGGTSCQPIGAVGMGCLCSDGGSVGGDTDCAFCDDNCLNQNERCVNGQCQ